MLSMLAPVIGNLPAILSELLRRAHILLYDNSKEYRAIAGTRDVEFAHYGLSALINKYRHFANVGRTAQALAPYAEAGLPVFEKFNANKLAGSIGKMYSLTEVMNTEEEMQQIAQSRAQLESENQQLEQAQQAASVQSKVA